MEISIKKYGQDLKRLFNYKPYFVSVLLVSLISFGYAMFNTSISIDDLEYDRYVGSGNEMLASGRFGMWFWALIEGKYENSYLIDLIAVILFIMAATTFCVIFSRISAGKISAGALTIFSCMFISYPLMNEIWEYTGANASICGAYFFSALTILLMHEQIHSRKWRNPWRIIVSALLMMIVCAGYESVVAVYIFFVFAVLAMQMIYGKAKEKKFLEFIRQGIIYASVLAAGLVLRIIFHKITLKILGLDAVVNGETKIVWGTKPVKEILKDLVVGWTQDYFVRGAVYFPLAVLVAAIVLFAVIAVILCKKHSFLIAVPSLGMLLCLFILSIVQGSVSPYRTCQIFSAFVAFAFMAAIEIIPKDKHKSVSTVRVIALVLCAYLCFSQASYMNSLLFANHRRSESEAFIVRQIAVDLGSFDEEKPVFFVGPHYVDDDVIESVSVSEDSFKWKLYEKLYVKTSEFFNVPYNVDWLSTKLPETNVRSKINWCMRAFWSQSSLLKLFEYYGYSFTPANFSVHHEIAKNYVEENNMPKFPKEGYIKDVGDYIIVHV